MGIKLFGDSPRPGDYPAQFKFMGGSTTTDSLKENAEIGTWQFEPPVPSEWKPNEVDMKRYFPFK